MRALSFINEATCECQPVYRSISSSVWSPSEYEQWLHPSPHTPTDVCVCTYIYKNFNVVGKDTEYCGLTALISQIIISICDNMTLMCRSNAFFSSEVICKVCEVKYVF